MGKLVHCEGLPSQIKVSSAFMASARGTRRMRRHCNAALSTAKTRSEKSRQRRAMLGQGRFHTLRQHREAKGPRLVRAWRQRQERRRTIIMVRCAAPPALIAQKNLF